MCSTLNATPPPASRLEIRIRVLLTISASKRACMPRCESHFAFFALACWRGSLRPTGPTRARTPRRLRSNNSRDLRVRTACKTRLLLGCNRCLCALDHSCFCGACLIGASAAHVRNRCLCGAWCLCSAPAFGASVALGIGAFVACHSSAPVRRLSYRRLCDACPPTPTPHIHTLICCTDFYIDRPHRQTHRHTHGYIHAYTHTICPLAVSQFVIPHHNTIFDGQVSDYNIGVFLWS